MKGMKGMTSLASPRVAALPLLAVLLVAWEAATRGSQVSTLVLPPPTLVVQSLWKGLASGYFWPHVVVTVTELALGLALGCIVGFVAGIGLAELAWARRLLMPYVVVSQAVPKLALMPMFVMWFGFGLLPTVLVTALICFFPLLETTLAGMRQVPAERLELFRMLGATRWQVVRRLKLPTGLPSVLAGLRIAAVLALVGVIVGEFIGSSHGLGALVIAAQGSMDTPRMFAVLILISALGLLLHLGAAWLERHLLRLYPHDHAHDHA